MSKLMPIMVGTGIQQRQLRGEQIVTVKSIPWEMIGDAHCEKWAQENHGQSLTGLARRGGLDAAEALCVIAGIRWTDFGGEENAHRILYAMHALFNRGQRVAEKRLAVPSPAGGAG